MNVSASVHARKRKTCAQPVEGPDVDIPIWDALSGLRSGGQSKGSAGLFATAMLVILDTGRALPADDSRAAKLVRLDTRSYRHSLAECISTGCLVRLPSGEVWAPVVAACRASRPRRLDRTPRAHIPMATREAVLAKTRGRCAYCAVTITLDAGQPTSFEPDHVLPVARGGSDDIANLIPSCMACNRKKRAQTALQFMGGSDAD